MKVLSCQKFRQGVRLEILCGKRALSYLSQSWEQARAVGQKLSVKPVEILPAVERLEAELAQTKLRTQELEEDLFAHIAREHAGAGDTLLIQPPMRPDRPGVWPTLWPTAAVLWPRSLPEKRIPTSMLWSMPTARTLPPWSNL